MNERQESLREKPSYPIVGTNMKRFFGPRGEIPRPEPGEPFYGQDAHYPKLEPAYRDNGDGTVSDLNTGADVAEDH